MLEISKIKRPTLLLDENKAKDNIKKIHQKVDKKNIFFRPHFKTHQSAEIGNWFKSFSTTAITVSSVEMAIYFFKNGWQDILIAFPVNLLELDDVANLAANTRLSLLVESKDSVFALAQKIKNPIRCWIKIDVGSYRTGINWKNFLEIFELAEYINSFKNLQFKGILSHAGHTYNAKSIREIQVIYTDTLKKLTDIKNFLNKNGIKNCNISVGDTPSTSVMDEFGETDEIRPGNFIFYDMQQYQLGVCRLNEIAVCLASPVVAIHPERNEAVIYGGAIHLSKDYYLDGNTNISFGSVVILNSHGWVDTEIIGKVRGLSQEHGILQFPNGIPESIEPGSVVGILPAHSCLTVQANRTYTNLSGEIIHTMLG